jgi:hypothetical protein
MAQWTDDDLIPEEIITATGDPLLLEDILKLIEDYPDYRICTSCMVKKADILYGTAIGHVNRIVIVPARKELIFCSDFGLWEETE